MCTCSSLRTGALSLARLATIGNVDAQVADPNRRAQRVRDDRKLQFGVMQVMRLRLSVDRVDGEERVEVEREKGNKQNGERPVMDD